MNLVSIIAAASAAATPAPAPVEAPEIVVRAVRQKCRVQLADRLLTNREFATKARQWARGEIVRVVSPRGANYQCLAKIAFKLNDYGVTRIHFVDRPEEP